MNNRGVLRKALGGPIGGSGALPQPMQGQGRIAMPSPLNPLAGMGSMDAGLGESAGRLGTLYKATGGKASPVISMVKVVKDAIGHLYNNDASSAAQTLKGLDLPEAKDATNDLRYGTPGVKKAIQKLESLVESFSNQEELPMMAKGGKVSGASKIVQALRDKGHTDLATKAESVLSKVSPKKIWSLFEDHDPDFLKPHEKAGMDLFDEIMDKDDSINLE